MAIVVVVLSTTISSVYLYTGFSKEAYLKLLNIIPAKNFGYVMIPVIIMSYAVTVWLVKKLFNINYFKKEPNVKVDLRDVIDNNLMHVEK